MTYGSLVNLLREREKKRERLYSSDLVFPLSSHIGRKVLKHVRHDRGEGLFLLDIFFSHRSFFLFFNLWNNVILLFVEENVGHARHLLFVNRSLEREKL